VGALQDQRQIGQQAKHHAPLTLIQAIGLTEDDKDLTLWIFE